MSSEQGGKAKPLKQPKKDKAEYDEVIFRGKRMRRIPIQKKKDEEKPFPTYIQRNEEQVKVMKELRDKALSINNTSFKPFPAYIQRKEEQVKALKDLKAMMAAQGSYGGTGLKKSGKK